MEFDLKKKTWQRSIAVESSLEERCRLFQESLRGGVVEGETDLCVAVVALAHSSTEDGVVDGVGHVADAGQRLGGGEGGGVGGRRLLQQHDAADDEQQGQQVGAVGRQSVRMCLLHGVRLCANVAKDQLGYGRPDSPRDSQ